MADVVVSPFPLLKLPNNALMNVLRIMDRCPQIIFSLCSKMTKALVRSLNLKVERITITPGLIISIWLRFNERPNVDVSLFNGNRRAPNDLRQFTLNRISASASYGGEENERVTFNWNDPGFGIRDLAIHFLEVFNISLLDFHFHQTEVSTDSLSIFEGIPINRLEIQPLGSNIYCQRLLETFHCTRQLILYSTPFRDSKSVHKILMQNFDYLYLADGVTFDDVLIVNSSIFKGYYWKLSENELNLFVKNWTEGFNSRLEITILYPQRTTPYLKLFDVNVVLKDVEYIAVPPEQERMFKRSVVGHDFKKEDKIRGGYDIHRIDGTKATIVFSPRMFSFEMYVWN